MDAIERRRSFAAAAEELGRVPSALSYTMQKLEEELDVVLFDRSGHRTKFTPVGRLLLERGRILLEAADKLTSDAEALSRGWETNISVVTEVLVSAWRLFPLVNRLAEKSDTQLSITTEVLAGAWEQLELGKADIVIGPSGYLRQSAEINFISLYKVCSQYVASPDHPIHQEENPLDDAVRLKYRGVAIADTAKERPILTVKVLEKQRRLTVSSLEDKHKALVAGLGIGSMPSDAIQDDLKAGRLKIIGNDPGSEVEIIMAWRRDQIGKAKAWLLREIPKLFS
ncbi:HTH-type transcriptional activator AllS [Pragia fontium]|uniref:DNA-binding transcriptional regulator, LysR family n=2 Tax=Pragia fontium TaxID=82985 RepID=A0AAJ4W9V8_9GAMM|nr:DNA-binding transcriptional regulator, LysR family [Pragia fontium DSM 5563 = ATCC 49100]SUB83670.1 HTH-type transcriptional activator AllS [Pragia fontium]VEJ56575.1 HTH-type transcriptional activator AllS [Pragia fontium]